MNQIRRSIAVCSAAVLMIGAVQTVVAQGPPPPDFLVTVRSAHDFNATLATLKQAIEGENLMVVNEVNPQQMLRMVGVRTGGMRQIFFFHPRYMKGIIETNRNGGIEPPLKILVMETPNGQVWSAIMIPSTSSRPTTDWRRSPPSCAESSRRSSTPFGSRGSH